MITSFPLKIKDCKLFVEDFICFTKEYRQLVLVEVPTSQDVRLINLAKPNDLPATLKEAIEQCVLNDQTAVFVDDQLLLMFSCENGDVIALVSGLDSMVIAKSSSDWLESVQEQIVQRMLQLKSDRVDQETGLLNQNHLNSRLHDNCTLFLVEVPPPRIGSKYIFSHLQAVTNSLLIYIQNPASVYYLGNALFAVCLQSVSNPLQYSEALVAYLKREGVKKVHIGVGDHIEAGSEYGTQENVLDQAWTALQEAVRRGPYSFCSFSSLLKLANHPLTAPPTSLKKQLSRYVRSTSKFSVILFQTNDADVESFANQVQELCKTGKIFVWGSDVLTVLVDSTAAKAYEVANDVIEALQKKGEQISAGVSSFPFLQYKKTETILLARKALLHTGFYGSGTATIFDEVSCNISGDIYYSEGNFTSAAKEYRLGLEINPQEVNLLNSLGVTYAMMGKKQSLDCFERVTKNEPDNFMALYNLGLYYLTEEQTRAAVKYFEKALLVVDEELENKDAVKLDLQLQLGILCCKLSKASRAIDLLLPLTSDKEFSCKHNILFYLGKSYFDAGQRKEAIRWLQKAAAAKCFEDQTLSLLGYLYHLEGQGYEIALSLCRKSVALNSMDYTLSLRLAEVLCACGQLEEAMQLAKKAVRKKQFNKKANKILKKIKQKIDNYN